MNFFHGHVGRALGIFRILLPHNSTVRECTRARLVIQGSQRNVGHEDRAIYWGRYVDLPTGIKIWHTGANDSPTKPRGQPLAMNHAPRVFFNLSTRIEAVAVGGGSSTAPSRSRTPTAAFRAGFCMTYNLHAILYHREPYPQLPVCLEVQATVSGNRFTPGWLGLCTTQEEVAVNWSEACEFATRCAGSSTAVNNGLVWQWCTELRCGTEIQSMNFLNIVAEVGYILARSSGPMEAASPEFVLHFTRPHYPTLDGRPDGFLLPLSALTTDEIGKPHVIPPPAAEVQKKHRPKLMAQSAGLMANQDFAAWLATPKSSRSLLPHFYRYPEVDSTPTVQKMPEEEKSTFLEVDHQIPRAKLDSLPLYDGRFSLKLIYTVSRARHTRKTCRRGGIKKLLLPDRDSVEGVNVLRDLGSWSGAAFANIRATQRIDKKFSHSLRDVAEGEIVVFIPRKPAHWYNEPAIEELDNIGILHRDKFAKRAPVFSSAGPMGLKMEASLATLAWRILIAAHCRAVRSF
ncbi:hypothetical protein B0H11DRAFT_2329248 [Mycena galericulata]|nr:hypothetical protein B0H11DRAFT_2329248 [Mycena galericulata]